VATEAGTWCLNPKRTPNGPWLNLKLAFIRRNQPTGTHQNENIAEGPRAFFCEQPILNTPYHAPREPWELDQDGRPIDNISPRRRKAELVSPIGDVAEKARTAVTWRIRHAIR
jgi:hypothetical protein